MADIDTVGRKPAHNATIQVRLGPKLTWLLRQIATLEGISAHDAARRAIRQTLRNYCFDMLMDGPRNTVLLREDWDEAVDRLQGQTTEPAPDGTKGYLAESDQQLSWLPF